jgi:drug/metabolite transporter (DMT)-like permease
VYSHLFLKEKLQGVEWAAVALAFVGTIGLGATSGSGEEEGAAAAAAAATAAAADAAAAAAGAGGENAAAAAVRAAVKAGGDTAAGAGEPGALRMLGVLLLLSAAVVAVSVWRNRHRSRQRRSGDRPAAAAYGLQAGACFGLSAASCRIGGLRRCGAGPPLLLLGRRMTVCPLLLTTAAAGDVLHAL